MTSSNLQMGRPGQPGTLFLVGTPIGNPGDLSPRARATLESADLILAEDTRRAVASAKRWNLRLPQIQSLHEHNEEQSLKALLGRLEQGQNLALISDAGMPVLADPGFPLVRACRERGLPVSVVPGPSAVLTALAGSGLPPQPFTFFGFLPRKAAEQEKLLAPFANVQSSLVFFERKDRLTDSLAAVLRVLGPRQACVCRELTKEHEEFINFRLGAEPDFSVLLGEVTVIVGPPEQGGKTPVAQLKEIMDREALDGGTLREVARRVQTQTLGWPSREIYAMLSASKMEKK